VGNSPWRKSLWLLFFFVIEGICRPIRVRSVHPLCRWVVLNNIVEYGFLLALGLTAGWKADLYLFLATFFSIGLHPCGARWIQEHYVYAPGQETYSYYGPLNLVNYQIGHHNEHHDLPVIAWNNLPRLRKMAPEFYDTLYYHTSYTKLLLSFILRRDITLYNRVTRPPHQVGVRAGAIRMKASELAV
jgi:sphingolipid delta-4 desaturase